MSGNGAWTGVPAIEPVACCAAGRGSATASSFCDRRVATTVIPRLESTTSGFVFWLRWSAARGQPPLLRSFFEPESLDGPVRGRNEGGGQSKERRFSTASGVRVISRRALVQGAESSQVQDEPALLPNRRAVGNRPSLKESTRWLPNCPTLSFTPTGSGALDSLFRGR